MGTESRTIQMMQRAILILFLFSGFVKAQPRPTASQLAWHDMEFYLFAHFGPNTFTGLEWGHGNEKEEIFNPAQLDCEQWCRVAKAAGAKGIIITAKHHDGFCLWPSKYSSHTVRESKWKHGKGDLLKDLSAACKKYGLKFGVYLSPWDRNHPLYGTPGYNDVFANMLEEVFTQYGPIWELWWDGANGEGPNGKQQEYDFARFEKLVRKLSPSTIIFSDIGPDIRWVGNEQGFAGETNWNYLDTAGFKRGAGAPPQDTLTAGNRHGRLWIPAECDVSIRPGWFWHKEENDKVKTPDELFQLYLKSVGRGANLLLNVPPDTNGLLHAADSAALVDFHRLKKKAFAVNIAKRGKAYLVRATQNRPAPAINNGSEEDYDKFDDAHSLVIELQKPAAVNCIVLKEFIKEGQFCGNFTVHLVNKKEKTVTAIQGTTIGHKRILSFPKTMVTTISITGKNGNAVGLREMEAYLVNKD